MEVRIHKLSSNFITSQLHTTPKFGLGHVPSSPTCKKKSTYRHASMGTGKISPIHVDHLRTLHGPHQPSSTFHNQSFYHRQHPILLNKHSLRYVVRVQLHRLSGLSFVIERDLIRKWELQREGQRIEAVLLKQRWSNGITCSGEADHYS